MPHGLEAPIPIMFWDPLEFVFAITLMGFGVVTKLWLFGMIAGAGVLWGAKYLKRGSKRGSVQHLFWAYGVQMDNSLRTKFQPSWLNDFIE